MIDGPVILALRIHEPNAVETILAAVIPDSSLFANLVPLLAGMRPKFLQHDYAQGRDGLLHLPAIVTDEPRSWLARLVRQHEA